MHGYPARGCAAKPRVDRQRSVNPGSTTGCGANPERVLQNVNPRPTAHRSQFRTSLVSGVFVGAFFLAALGSPVGGGAWSSLAAGPSSSVSNGVRASAQT